MNHLAWRRAGLGALAAVTLGAALPAHAEGVVNLYTNREPGLYPPLLDEFTKATGIKVNTVFSEQGLAERIKAEGENSPADVLITVDIGRLQQARRSRRHAAGRAPRRSAPNDPGQSPRSGGPLVRALAARPRRSMPRRTRVQDTRSPTRTSPTRSGRASSAPAPASTSTTSRLDRRDDRQARRGEDRGMAAAASRRTSPRSPSGGDRDVASDILAGVCDIGLGNTYYVGLMTNGAAPSSRNGREAINVHPADLRGRRHARERLRRGAREERAEHATTP